MLQITHVYKEFGDLTAVSDLNFSLGSGEVLGLIGQNGAGKSTTFKMILSFLRPTHGDILFNDHSISVDDLDLIGYMPEERGLYLDMTIKQQVLYFASLHNYDKKKALADLTYWMDKLAVKGRLNDKIKSLSKGNQQKVQLISSFIHHPKLLILDEPFSGLDPVNTELLIEAVLDLKRQGTSIIFSSHDMRNVERLSTKLLLLINGHTRLSGDIQTIKSSFGKTNLYLENAFSYDEINSMNGVINIQQDYPGYHIVFDTEESANEALDKAKKTNALTGYRLFEPDLDSIFKQVTQENK